MNKIKISPSILAGDFAFLANEAMRLQNAGADLIHLDVMDGHFVPNITFGPQVVETIKKHVSIPLDVHLMISHPDKYAQAFIDAGADYITVHVESSHDLLQTIQFIKKQNVKVGPAINPDKSIALIKHVLPYADIVLVMSVFPGFGGQKFIPDVLSKVKELVNLKRTFNYNYEIEIDGGINTETIKLAKEAGIDIAVAGTAVFKALDMQQMIEQLKIG